MINMDHEDSIPFFLSNAQRFGMNLGLDRMQELMCRLNNPQNDCKFLHVAGTNGKGSVAAYLSTILACADFKVGIYTSPFIERFSERIRILNGIKATESFFKDSSHGEIPSKDLKFYSSKVEDAVHSMIEDHFEHPTEFELMTAIAFLYFADSQCDYVVLETGLGGRFDATNIIARPICSVIAAIGYDHMDCLGDTIDKIAFEKAGIVKEGCPVFLTDLTACDLSDEDAFLAKKTIEDVCRLRDARLHEIKSNNISLIHQDIMGQTFEVKNFPLSLKTRMHGVHQRMNAALAVHVLKEWISPEDIECGIRNTFWKARNEVISQRPLVVLDGAHNPQSMARFAQTANALLNINLLPRIRLIIGMLKDKDVRATLQALSDYSEFEFEDIVCVTIDHPRAMPAKDLADLFREIFENQDTFYNNSLSGYNVQSIIRVSEDTKRECLETLIQSQKDCIPVFCTGSLYLIGEIRSVFMDKIKETQR